MSKSINPCKEIALLPDQYDLNNRAIWDSNYKNNYGYGNTYYDSDWVPNKNKRKHEFSPILLVYTTAYDCKHCGRKKEDCKTEYCEDEGSPPSWDIGGW